MKTINTTCDNCEKPIDDSGPSTDYLITVSCSKIPQTGGISHAMYVHPPLDRDYHFCDMACIKRYLWQESL